MTNVVAFKDSIPPGEANPEIIADLERLLDRARSGELRAIAYCTIGLDTKGTGWTGSDGTRDPLSSAIGMLQHRYFSAMLGEE